MIFSVATILKKVNYKRVIRSNTLFSFSPKLFIFVFVNNRSMLEEYFYMSVIKFGEIMHLISFFFAGFYVTKSTPDAIR